MSGEYGEDAVDPRKRQAPPEEPGNLVAAGARALPKGVCSQGRDVFFVDLATGCSRAARARLPEAGFLLRGGTRRSGQATGEGTLPGPAFSACSPGLALRSPHGERLLLGGFRRRAQAVGGGQGGGACRRQESSPDPCRVAWPPPVAFASTGSTFARTFAQPSLAPRAPRANLPPTFLPVAPPSPSVPGTPLGSMSLLAPPVLNGRCKGAAPRRFQGHAARLLESQF